MPNLITHIAIARKYLASHKDIEDEIAFIKGSIAPDLSLDKNVSHFSYKRNSDNLSDYLKKKVGIQDYLAVTKIDNDYEKDYFLHLLTDYFFFSRVFG